MNNNDRKQLAALVATLETLKAQAEDIGSQLREMADAEQEKFDNLSEGLQQADKGQEIENAANVIGQAADYLESGDIGSALDDLEELA